MGDLKKALVIFENQSSGKITKAIRKAKKFGTFSVINIDNFFGAFSLSSILKNNPDVVIVDGCTPKILNDPRIKLLISEDHLLINKKGENPETVPNIKWIFIVCIDRRFSVITV